MSAEFFAACERLLSATANGVYQGILVAAVAGLSLRLFARTNAATRHAVWFGVLLFVSALIPAHLLLSERSRPEIPTAPMPPTADTMAVSPVPSYLGSTVTSLVDDAEFSVAQPDQSGAAPHEDWASREIGSTKLDDGAVTVNAGSRFARAILKPFSRSFKTAVSLPHSICLCLVSAWVLLASIRGGLIAARIGEVRRIKTTSTAPSQGLQTLFERLRSSLSARRNVQLKISGAHSAAVVLGFVHPVILLPAEMDKDGNEGELEHVLRHELAHVDRRDDWGNLAQHLVQAALFFHPAVWWISAKLSLEREIACDDHVLEVSGRPRAYALTLANVASRMSQCRHLLAPGVSNNNSQLQQRITMILNTHRDRSPRLARSRVGFFTAATAMLAVLALNAGPRLVLAQSPDEAPATSGAVATAPPDAPVADAAPATLPPSFSGAQSGPRPKPDAGNDDYAPSASQAEIVSAALPAAPAPPAEPMVAAEPAPALPPLPAAAPVPPEPKEHHGPRAMRPRMSIEERLDRIERIVESLQAHEGTKSSHGGGDVFASNPDWSQPHSPDFNFDLTFTRNAEMAKRMAEQAQRAAEAGQRSAEQAVRDFEKLKSKDFELSKEKMREMESESSARELEALRSARESLDKEMKNLTQQIQRLEAERDRLQKPAQRSPDDSDNAPKSE